MFRTAESQDQNPEDLSLLTSTSIVDVAVQASESNLPDSNWVVGPSLRTRNLKIRCSNMHGLDQRDFRRDGTAGMDVGLGWLDAPGHESIYQPILLVDFSIKLFESWRRILGWIRL